MGLLWFVLPPPLIFAFQYFRSRRSARQPLNPLLLTLGVALLSVVGVFALATLSDKWRGGTRIAWLGLDAPSRGAATQLGGEPAGFTLGWPGGHWWPAVRVVPAGGGAARIEVRGGAGLVEAGGAPINGRPLLAGADLPIDRFRIRLVDPWLGARRVEIRTATPSNVEATTWWQRIRRWWTDADPPVARVPLTRPLSGVLPIAPVIARPVMELRRGGSPNDLQLAVALEEWAARVSLGFAEDDSLRLLVDEPSETVAQDGVALPVVLTVRWPQRVLRAQVWEVEQRLHVGFLPPWRVASPLPPRPEQPSDQIPLTIAPAPRPGELVFELPFGRGVRDLRLALPIVNHPSRGEIFSGAPEPEERLLLPPGATRAAETRTYFAERVRSTTCVPAEPAHPCIGLVQDVARPAALLEVLAVAFVCFAAALATLGPLLHRVPTAAWTIAAILAAVWNLLIVRFLLALRYGLDPTGLDRMAVNGVALAAGALVLIPACLAGTVILYRERFVVRTAPQARMRFFQLLVGLLATGGLALFEARRALRLWPNLPSEFDLGVPGGLIVLVTLLVVAGAFAMMHQLLLDDTEQARWRSSSVLYAPLSWLRRMADLWRQSRDLRHDWRFWILPGAALLLFIAVLLAMFMIGRGVVGDVKLVTEFLLPVLVGSACALFWIASLQAFRPGTNYRRQPLPRWTELIAPTIAFVGVPALVPLIFGDSGGLFSMIGLFVPLGALLVFSRHSRFGAAVLCGCALILLALSLTIRHVSNLPATALSLSERGAARVTAYMHGNDVQRMLPLARAISDAGEGLPAGALRGALEHPWETRAIVYRAGWLGPGYSGAPNRRSKVPQAVLQYDSTFSFFVAGDFGLLGGFGLFLLYSCPLVAVLVAARRRLDAGHAVAIVFAAWLLNEAAVHAAVNLGSLPFTGRNLPFLSVNSAADLLRWTVMCWLIVVAVLWRTTGSEFLLSDDVAIVAADPEPEPETSLDSSFEAQPWPDPSNPSLATAPVAILEKPVAIRRAWSWLRVPRVRAMTAVSVVCGAAVVVLVVLPGERVLRRHAALGDPFDWTPFFKEVQRYLDDGLLKWDAATWTLDASPLAARGVRLNGTSLLEQEIARFNALPRVDKAELPESVAADLKNVSTPEEYDAFLEALRLRDAARRPPVPSLFRVARRTVIRDDGGEQVFEFPRVDFASNTTVSFAAEASRDDMPNVRFRDRRGDKGVVTGSALIGPAWVSGRWETAYHIGRTVPWVESLKNAVEAESGRRDRERAERKRFEMLTLDETLQTQAMDFVAAVGRRRHGSLLALGMQRNDPYKALPPRIALAALSLPDGAVIASGSWPRMTPAPGWRSSPQGLLPPSAWLQTRAPGPFAYRYAGDRNFDPIEMGSATKPIWAAAALRVHPFIRQQLRTSGPKGRERDVFGIPIAPDLGGGWDVPGAPDWVGFQQYLSRSDNRYHVRLGFLAIAEAQQGRFVSDGQSASEVESLSFRDGQPAAWRRVPRFVPEVGFSVRQPNYFQDLNRTRLAAELRQLFGISIEAGDYEARRRSMWTLSEEDDRFGAPAASLSSRFLEISPAVPHLALHNVRSAREYVSLLLGGDDNRWSNIDFAAAFATAVSGRPVVAHMVPGETRSWSGRVPFPEVAAQLRPGLAETVRAGTATRALQASGALQWIQSLGVAAYAKTGTLSTDRGSTETSRLVIALVRWKDQAKGEIARGLVLSMVVERAEMGYAADALSEFMYANRTLLARELGG